MTNQSKFWLGLLVVGAVAGTAYVANRVRLEAPTAQSSSAPAAIAATAPDSLPMPAPAARRAVSVSSSPEVTAQLAGVLRPLLQPGTDLSMAAQGFASRESFVATAYAAKNLSVPFVLLKDRVVARQMSLAAAIGQLKPEVNARIEADRATAEALSEIARLIT